MLRGREENGEFEGYFLTLKLISNIDALRAVRQLGKTTASIASVYERLSSGQRINRASDDAAGLSVATALNSSARIFGAAIRNLNDGLSLANIADGALSNLSDITGRLKELATQAANGTYSKAQRGAMDEEADALVSEYNRILSSTQFNGVNIFDGSQEQIVLQAGIGADATLTLGLTPGTPYSFVGDGTFGTTLSQNVGAGTGLPRGSALADVNRDGILDIIVADDTAQRANIMLGNGDGSFRPGGSYATQSRVYSITVADFNGDGVADFATSDHFFGTSVFLNNGDGTFSRSATIAVTTVTDEIASGDLNGDGFADIVIPHQYSGSLTVLLGNGNGTFRTGVSYASASGSAGVELVDVNNDNKLDIISMDYATQSIRVLYGNGNGSFSAQSQVALGIPAARILTGDFNDDGEIDVAAIGTGSVKLLLGNGNGTFRSGASISIPSAVGWTIATGDFNSDGFDDLAVKLLTGANNRIGVLFGNGDCSFAQVNEIPSFGGSSGVGNANFISVGDLNGDGVDDLTLVDGIGRLWTSLANTDRNLRLQQFNMHTRSGALEALAVIDRAQENVLDLRGRIGGSTARIQIAVDTLTLTRENYLAAESRIRDADVAADSAELVRLQILQRAGAAILAQAKVQPELALKLLE